MDGMGSVVFLTDLPWPVACGGVRSYKNRGDFATRIQETVKLLRGGKLVFEPLNSALRWREFVCPVAPTFSFPRPLSNKSSIPKRSGSL